MRISASATEGSSAAAGEEDLFEIASSKLPADTASRVKFETAAGSTTMEELLQYATTEANPESTDSKAPSLVVIGRGSGKKMEEGKLDHKMKEDLKLCLGVLAGHFVAGGARADLLVVQSKKRPEAS